MTGLALARPLATWFGLGHAPKAPGTMGALGTLPLHYALCRLHPGLHAATVLVVAALGVWAAGAVAEDDGDDDPSHVVIDEVVGTLIALGLVRTRSFGARLVAFALFRVLDITKPGPIARAEHARPPGLGIMLDDVLAGLAAGLLARRL